jgi:cytidylate kinase
VVVAGRDIGTVVLPDADVKVYLDAPLAERARRRLRQLRELGQRATLQEVMRELQHRDEMDSHRPVAPLRPAPDAVIIDTEGLSLEQVVERVMSLVEARCA